MRNSTTEQRRLLAVVVADIVSYSRLMAENEADTFYRLKDLQASLIVPAVDRNHGRIVKWTGDGFLGTFDSAVDAVRAAVEIQSGTAAAGVAAPDDKRIRFRIGINSGDVIVVPGDVYGDTVNVAARLEAAAPPGGICISRGVRDTVRGKFSVEFEDRGELAVKNIPDPVGAFDVRFDPIAWTMARDEAVPVRNRRRFQIAAAALALLLVATVGSGWYLLKQPAGEAQHTQSAGSGVPASPSAASNASSLHQQLLERIAAASPALSPKARAEVADAYEKNPPHKALAVSSEPAGNWRSGSRPSAEDAEEAALENCQIFYVHGCVLIAVDDTARPVPPTGNWPRRYMPRVGYTGSFDPEQIPGVFPAARERADVIKYRSAAPPKAAALTPTGARIFTVTNGANQHAAEEEALRSCIADPARSRDGGPCYLYASADHVVLSLRQTAPLTAAATAAAEHPPAVAPQTATPPAAAASPAPAPSPVGAASAESSLHAALSQRLAAVVPGIPPRLRDETTRTYEAAPRAKALVASLDPLGLWRAMERPSVENAEAAALENCQVVYGQPCVLIAVNDALSPAAADNHWPHRDMPRAHYAGLFEPDKIPGTLPELQHRADIVSYRAARGSKAAAFSPQGGRVFVIVGAANQRAAEVDALKACEAARPPAGIDKALCFLYAVGDQVVLPRRLKEALTAAASN